MVESSAPGKVILFGEHAVVYNRPAIAVPVTQVQATAQVRAGPAGAGCTVQAVNLGRAVNVATARADDPLAAAVHVTLAHLQAPMPDVVVSVRSTIPIAGGMGSGAAVSAAIIRALAAYLEQPLDDDVVSALVFQVEKLHHGTPSGIDNTVVVYARPVYFVKGQPIETFRLPAPLHLAIGDTGVASPTRIAVGDVRMAWQADPARYESLFQRAGEIAHRGRRALGRGDWAAVGAEMDANHALLQALGVSCQCLDKLVIAARRAGALGAKLSGGGRGGNMVALITPAVRVSVEHALRQAGAKNVILTQIDP